VSYYTNEVSAVRLVFWGRLSSLPNGIPAIGRLKSLLHKSKPSKDFSL
jgi:hypothetical protein